jgi:hypothetical protein
MPAKHSSKNTYLFYYCFIQFICLSLSASKPNLSLKAFIENEGQILNQTNEPNKDVLFLYSNKRLKIQLKKTGYSYDLSSIPNYKKSTFNDLDYKSSESTDIFINTHRIDVDFLNMSSQVEIVKEGRSIDYINYYLNGKEMRHICSYSKIIYKNVFKKTDIEFIISNDENNPFKYNIILHPGADISSVKFLVNGASEVKLENDALVICTSQGDIKESIPMSYYAHTPDKNQFVSFNCTKNVFSFSANYDTSKTFVIDPASNLVWGTYYGDNLTDYCTSAGVDSLDNVYIAGQTLSTANIATNGTYQSTLNGSLDGYLAKFNSSGVRQWATYFGGSESEKLVDLFVEPNGTCYVSGDTFSSSNIASSAAHQPTYGGGIDDALVVKFDQNGLRLWSTYFGGTEHDIAEAITVDKLGNVIITGHTESTNNIATVGSYQPNYNFGYDVFVAKFNTSGTLLWATYYGDSGLEEAYSVACDTLNNIYITGLTQSIVGISTPGVHQINQSGFQDAFLAKFDAANGFLLWGTYYGGSAVERGNSIIVSKTGYIFVGGNTSSNNGISTINSYQPQFGGSNDVFIACFDLNGTRQWATYYGGSDADYLEDLKLDANNNILFCGQTLSTNSISTNGAYQTSLASVFNYDAYFAKFSSNGAIKLATYFGGTSNDNAKGIAIGKNGKVYLAGETTSTLGIATPSTHMASAGGSTDGFLARFCTILEPLINPSGVTTLCIGNNTLTASTGYATYLWNTTSTQNPLITNNTTTIGTYTFNVYVTDGVGCEGTSATSIIEIAQCYVSVPDEKNFQEILIYPNPSEDLITIEFKNVFISETASVKIYAYTGELVLKQEITSHRSNLNIKNLASGMYLLRTTANDKVIENKFLKQ